MLSIAVITPSLNQGRFIERTIRSVLNQDYAPLQYVVCDAASTDDTCTILDRFGLLDERLHYCLDYEYWLRLAGGGAVFRYVPKLLACSRQYPETKTLRARLALHGELNTMLRERLGRVPDSWLLNHAHTLVELRRADHRPHLVPYALAVVLQCAALSWRWNGSVSPGLMRTALGPVASGVGRRLTESGLSTSRSP